MSDGLANGDLRFGDRDALEKWLKTQPREVSVIVAARAALRVLPLAATKLPAKKDAERFASLISALFRAGSLTRFAAKYPTRALELRATFFLASDTFVGVIDDGPTLAAKAAMNAAAVAAQALSHAQFAARGYVIDRAADFERTNFARAAVSSVDGSVARTAADAALAAAIAVLAPYLVWASLSSDVHFLDAGGAVVVLADCPLWASGNPQDVDELWAKLKAALPPGEDWEVWTRWYDERLAGQLSRGEAYELVFATVPEEVWDKGPAAANRWIKEHLPPEAASFNPTDPRLAYGIFGSYAGEEHLPAEPPSTPKPLENIPCAFTFGWSASQKITVIAGPQNQPIFPFATSEADHKQWLETCHALTERLLSDLRAGRFNLRPDYCEALERYKADLPTAPGQGNFMLAEQEALNLRGLFEAEVDLIAAPFASRLRGLLQQHIALRGFYPVVERYYDAVRKSRIDDPLPWDKVEGFGRTVRDNTPDKFEPEISKGLQDVEREEPVIEPVDVPHDPKAIQPPPDPLGPVNREDSRSFNIASFVNGIMKVVVKGRDVSQAFDGWEHLEQKLWEDAASIIEWLHKLPPN
jgi:hypothetical protein